MRILVYFFLYMANSLWMKEQTNSQSQIHFWSIDLDKALEIIYEFVDLIFICFWI